MLTDIQKNPSLALKKMCISIGISFSEKMLKWPKGKRKSDGVWAKYWYGNVESSSGFKPFYKKQITIEKEFRALYKECLTEYNSMYEKELLFKNLEIYFLIIFFILLISIPFLYRFIRVGEFGWFLNNTSSLDNMIKIIITLKDLELFKY